jgi:hypothetical protein
MIKLELMVNIKRDGAGWGIRTIMTALRGVINGPRSSCLIGVVLHDRILRINVWFRDVAGVCAKKWQLEYS